MNNIWKYKIDITNEKIFEEIGQERGISFPDDLKKFILENNAATPAEYNFMVGNNERVFGSVLSFNHNETEADSVFTILPAIEDKNLIPFGIDPFGNYICYRTTDKAIVFCDHESDDISLVANSLSSFLKGLY